MPNKNFSRIHSQLDLPFLETPRKVIEGIFKTLESRFGLTIGSEQKFIDLGSGDGRLVIYSALNYHILSLGVEINSGLIKEARDKIESLKKEKKIEKNILRKVIFKEADFYDMSLSDYDFIYIYSLPTMHKYLDHLFKTTKEGAIIISHKFPFKEWFSYLELRYILEHNSTNQKTSTFFYCRLK